MRVGLFPFGGVANPYTTLIGRCLDMAAISWKPIQDTKWFPVQRALRQGIDILQMYWPSNLYKSSTWLGTMAKRLMFFDGLRRLENFPFVHSVDNLWPHDSKDESYDRAVTQKLLSYADGLIVTVPAAKDILLQTYRLPADVVWGYIPHCNYMDWYPNCISKGAARDLLGLQSARSVLLALGRIAAYKGLSGLVEAFFAANVVGSVLLVAGRPQSDAALAGVAESIRRASRGKSCEVRLVPRFIEDDEVQIFVNASDALAVSYADVPMNPGSVVLAMSFGRCVLAPRKGVTANILGPECFFGYDESDRDSYVAAIRTILQANDLDRRGAVAMDRASQNHSPEVVAECFRSFYAGLRNRL